MFSLDAIGLKLVDVDNISGVPICFLSLRNIYGIAVNCIGFDLESIWILKKKMISAWYTFYNNM